MRRTGLRVCVRRGTVALCHAGASDDEEAPSNIPRPLINHNPVAPPPTANPQVFGALSDEGGGHRCLSGPGASMPKPFAKGAEAVECGDAASVAKAQAALGTRVPPRDALKGKAPEARGGPKGG